MPLTDADMPVLFTDADTASLAGQTTYLRLVKADIALVILAAAVGSISPTDPTAKTVVAFLTAGFFGLSIIVSAVLGARRYEQRWYGGRAIAESVKTLAWRYSTRAEPFNGTDAAADARFTEDLKAILEERTHLATALILKAAIKNPQQISPAMRALRASSTKARLDAYLTGRVDDQRGWYRKKSAGSASAEGKWFIGIVVAQILGLGAAFVLLRWPDAPVNATGLFAAVAAAIATWMQVRRHQEVAQSYAIASHELGLIYEQGDRVTTDEQLSLFVSDAENAISREHTLWTARRDT